MVEVGNGRTTLFWMTNLLCQTSHAYFWELHQYGKCSSKPICCRSSLSMHGSKTFMEDLSMVRSTPSGIHFTHVKPTALKALQIPATENLACLSRVRVPGAVVLLEVFMWPQRCGCVWGGCVFRATMQMSSKLSFHLFFICQICSWEILLKWISLAFF